MKTFAHSLLTALLLSTATFAGTEITVPTTASNPAVTTSSYKVAIFPAATPTRLSVFVERNPGLVMLVSLKSADGTTLAKEFIGKKQGSFRFQFDLSELQDGAYKVEVLSGTDVTIYPLTLSTQPAKAETRQLSVN